MKNKEIWKPVTDWEEVYEVSSLGRIRSLDRTVRVNREILGGPHYRKLKGQILKPKLDRYGYPVVNLLNNGRSKHTTVHRLIAREFVEGYFKGAQVNHKNFNKQDNRPENLEWCSNQENQDHSNSRGLRRGSSNGNSKLSEKEVIKIKELISLGLSNQEIGQKFKVSGVTVSCIRTKKTWAHV